MVGWLGESKAVLLEVGQRTKLILWLCFCITHQNFGDGMNPPIWLVDYFLSSHCYWVREKVVGKCDGDYIVTTASALHLMPFYSLLDQFSQFHTTQNPCTTCARGIIHILLLLVECCPDGKGNAVASVVQWTETALMGPDRMGETWFDLWLSMESLWKVCLVGMRIGSKNLGWNLEYADEASFLVSKI